MTGRYENSEWTRRSLSHLGMRDLHRLTAYFSMRWFFGPDWDGLSLFPEIPEPANFAKGLTGDEIRSNTEFVVVNGTEDGGLHGTIEDR